MRFSYRLPRQRDMELAAPSVASRLASSRLVRRRDWLGHQAHQGHAVAVQRRERLEHGHERHAARLVAGDGRLHAHAVLGHDPLAVEGGDLPRRVELGQPLLGAQSELQLITETRAWAAARRASASATALARRFRLRGRLH